MTTKLVDPIEVALNRIRETARTSSPSHEVFLDPPPGARLERLTVAGSYRDPITILYDAATRTAYPIRSTD